MVTAIDTGYYGSTLSNGYFTCICGVSSLGGTLHKATCNHPVASNPMPRHDEIKIIPRAEGYDHKLDMWR
jgi:hypothetical protein